MPIQQKTREPEQRQRKEECADHTKLLRLRIGRTAGRHLLLFDPLVNHPADLRERRSGAATDIVPRCVPVCRRRTRRIRKINDVARWYLGCISERYMIVVY